MILQDKEMRITIKTICFVFLFGLNCLLFAGEYECLTETKPITLKNHGELRLKFSTTKVKQRVLLSIQARIVIPRDTGATITPVSEEGYAGLLKGAGGMRGDYCLKIKINDKEVSPDTIEVINKKEIVDANSPVKNEKTNVTRIPMYSNGKWFLKADDDYVPGKYSFSTTDGIYSTRAYYSHYFEYLFNLTNLRFGPNTITLKVEMPAQMKDLSVEIKEVGVINPDMNFIVTAYDWMEAVFPWQTPRIENPSILKTKGSRNEYVPAAFSIYGLEDIPNIDIKISELRNSTSNSTIQPESIKIFQVKALERKSLGESAFISLMPFIPEEWINYSPELLIPIEEEKPSLKKFQTQPFFVDIKLPDSISSGLYSGKMKILSKDKILTEIPVEVEILPFDLSEARQKYWMWRIQWTPVWKPENIACLQDIKDHGFTGLVRTCGASFKFSVNKEGTVLVDGTEYESFVQVLKKTGLAMQIADDQVSSQLISAVLKHLDIKVKNIATEVVALPEETQQKIKPLVIQGFRKVKDICDQLGLILYIFPIDEPCGTPWKRAWTSYVAGLAKEAGLGTWSTRNNWYWNANLDIGVAGELMINYMYLDPRIVKGKYKGDLAFDALPMIGAFRDRPEYNFNGTIDEVRIYNRALTDDEMLNQHEKPADGDIIAYYSFDSARTDTAVDLSGQGNDARLFNNPEPVSGKKGYALRFDNNKENHLLPPNRKYDLNKGWSISIWYKGSGCLFGKTYGFYYAPGQIRYTTTEEYTFFTFGAAHDPYQWAHLTLVFDPVNKEIKAYTYDNEIKDWYRKNITWMYEQIRSMPPKNPRFKTGIQNWYYGNFGMLRNITTFCYDWNANHLYVVYPKDGNRFNPEGKWYRTLGWEGTRAGINDARYLQTLVDVLQKKAGMNERQAIEKVKEIITPISAGYDGINKVIETFGCYENMRKKVVDEIMKYYH